MSTIKEVKVALTDADVEALSRPATRRRVRRRVQDGGQGAPAAAGAADLVKVNSVAQPVVPAPTVVTSQTTVHATTQPTVQTTAAPTTQPTMVPVVQKESMSLTVPSATTMSSAPEAPVAIPISTASPSLTQSGGTIPVKIQTRKRTHGHQAPLPLNTTATRKIVGGAKIVPVKRHHMGTTATLKKKPRLLIGAPVVPLDPKVPQKPAQIPTPPKRRRRFTERRLSISVKNVSSTRKHRRSIKKQVAAMSLEDVRKTLIEKSILKPRSNPPETMMRSMMVDYLSLKA